MSTKSVSTFEITAWDVLSTDEPAEGPPIARITVKKVFRGDVSGESVADLITCRSVDDSAAAYTAIERVSGSLGGRTGSFVLAHGAASGLGEQRALGFVVPGSGTSELRGLRGEVEYTHDETGAVLTFEYDFAEDS